MANCNRPAIKRVKLEQIVIPCVSCLLVITNFKLVDLNPMPYTPLVLRRFFPVYFKYGSFPKDLNNALLCKTLLQSSTKEMDKTIL